MSISLIIVSTFECEENGSYFCYHHFFFLNSKANVFRNLNPFNSVNFSVYF